MKKVGLWVALNLIFLVVFNLSVFLFIKDYTPVFWTSIAFIHFAYFIMVLSVMVPPKRKDTAFLGFSIAYITNCYFILEFCLGLIFIVYRSANFNVAFIIQLILAGIFGFVIISNILANENIKASLQKDDENFVFIKNAVAELNSVYLNVSDTVICKKVEKLIESLKYSQVKSHPSLAGLEYSIIAAIRSLKQSVVIGDNSQINILIEDVNRSLDERNSQIKLLKSSS